MDGRGNIRSGTGRQTFKWTGRVNGALLPDATYTLRLTGGDAAPQSVSATIDTKPPSFSNISVTREPYDISLRTYKVQAKLDSGELAGLNPESVAVYIDNTSSSIISREFDHQSQTSITIVHIDGDEFNVPIETDFIVSANDLVANSEDSPFVGQPIFDALSYILTCGPDSTGYKLLAKPGGAASGDCGPPVYLGGLGVATGVPPAAYIAAGEATKRLNEFYAKGGVYVLVDKTTGVVKYVGMTTNLGRRLMEHGRHPVKRLYRFVELQRGMTYAEMRGFEQRIWELYKPVLNRQMPVSIRNKWGAYYQFKAGPIPIEIPL